LCERARAALLLYERRLRIRVTRVPRSRRQALRAAQFSSSDRSDAAAAARMVR